MMSGINDRYKRVRRQVMEVRLSSFDHRMLDKAVHGIVFEAGSHGMLVKGPVPLPTSHSSYVVNRSPHVNKKSREKFEIAVHKRLLIIDPNSKSLDSLMKLNLPSGVGVDVELKMM